MSFKSSSVKNQFRKNPAREAGQGGNTVYPINRAVEILEIDAEKGVLVGRDIFRNKYLEVIIDPDNQRRLTQNSMDKGVKLDKSKFVGYMIDERMEKNMPSGSVVILERTVPTGSKPVKRGDFEFMQLQANYVVNVKDPAPDKLFRAIASAYAYQGRISRFHVFKDDNLSAVDLDDRERIDAIMVELDRIAAERDLGNYPLPVGVQFRIMRDAGKVDRDGKPILETVELTDPFTDRADRHEGVGEDGKDIVSRGPLDRAALSALLFGADGDAGYEPSVLEYARETYGPDVRVDMMVFHRYSASGHDRGMQVSERSLLADLTGTESRLSLDDPRMVVGGNYGANLIMALTDDEYKNGRLVKVRDLVSSVFTDGYRGHIASMIRTADGCRVEVPAELDLQRNGVPLRSGNAASAPAATEASPAPVGGPPAAYDDSGFDDDDESDPFAQQFRKSVESANAAPEQPAVSAPQADAGEDRPDPSLNQSTAGGAGTSGSSQGSGGYVSRQRGGGGF